MRFLHVPAYVAWLIAQVFLAASQVVLDTLRPTMKQEPKLVAMPLRVSTDAEVSWLSLSITMTPGTLVCGTRNVGEPDGAREGGDRGERAGGDGDQRRLFIIHAIFGDDLDALFDSLYEMEERLAPRVRDLPRPTGFVIDEYDVDVHPDPDAITGTAAENDHGLPGPYPLAEDDVLESDREPAGGDPSGNPGGRGNGKAMKEEPRHE